MNDFSPKTVIDWYLKRPNWSKWMLFIVLAIGVVVAAIWWALTRSVGLAPSPKTEALEKVSNALEQKYKNGYDETKTQSGKIQEEIEMEWNERLKLEKQRQQEMKENKEKHEKLDEVITADDVVDMLNKFRSE